MLSLHKNARRLKIYASLEEYLKYDDNFLKIIEKIKTMEFDLEESKKFIFIEYFKEIRQRISSMFKNSPHVLKSQIIDEFYTQDGVKYLFKHLIKDEMKNKPINLSDDYKHEKVAKKDFFDPFEPPFTEGQVIEENFGGFETHRIFFSKFAVMPEHVLLVTRDFYSQYTHLTYEDVKNSVLLLNVMNGIIFFNGGKNAGASQPRKHLQCIPFSSMYDREFGIFDLVKNEENLEKKDLVDNISKGLASCYLIKKFLQNGINHILFKFSKDVTNALQILNEENIDIYSDLIFSIYNMSLIELNLIESEENLSTHYSILLTSEWMLVIPRKGHEVKLSKGKLNINSIGFLMTMLIPNSELGEEVKTKNILKEIYAEL
jgi:ATP adenylyltransferase